jgi:hypothetical protein
MWILLIFQYILVGSNLFWNQYKTKRELYLETIPFSVYIKLLPDFYKSFVAPITNKIYKNFQNLK